jgi:predicted Ser/Thr protein kinase
MESGDFNADSPPPFTLAEVAALFPQLDVLELLGRGGMGVVYKARQRTLGRLVALKLLAPERVADPRFAERFAHEAQALAALNHPSIVTIHDFGRVGDVYYLLMEFVDGVNLRQAITAGRFSPEQALAIIPPVCEALQYAHEHGIVHRDIKPENLLLDKAGRVKLADFGIAKMLRAEGDATAHAAEQPNNSFTSVAGTPQYMAPEQTKQQVTDHRADIYSLGVVLYELLTGELPADRIQPPSRKVRIDVRLDEIVLRALEKSPELRYQTAGEFRTQVETITNSKSPARVMPKMAVRFSRTAIVGACMVAMALLSLFFVLFGDEIAEQRALREGVSLADHPEMSLTTPMLGAMAIYAFAATILGWIAVTQIRRSPGKLDGLWLAVFDGLFYPLLALDTLILAASGSIVFLFRQFSNTEEIPIELILLLTVPGILTVALVAWIDFVIICAVWRAVRVPAGPLID